MSLSFTSVAYEDNHNCVPWLGLQCIDDKQFSDFLKANAADRLDDIEGEEEFHNHLH